MTVWKTEKYREIILFSEFGSIVGDKINIYTCMHTYGRIRRRLHRAYVHPHRRTRVYVPTYARVCMCVYQMQPRSGYDKVLLPLPHQGQRCLCFALFVRDSKRETMVINFFTFVIKTKQQSHCLSMG